MQLSQQNILSISKNTLSLAHEYLYLLSTYGVNSGYLEKFENEILEAEILLNRDLDIIRLKELTSQKNVDLESCYNWGRQLAIRIEIGFGKKSNEHINFPSKKLLTAQRNEKLLIPLMQVMIEISENYVEKLSDFGLTEETVLEGKKLYQNLKEINDLQKTKKNENKRKTNERKFQFKNLYETVNKINKIGRMVFRNEAHKKELFISPWKKPTQNNSTVIEGLVNPVSTKMILENLNNKTISLKNTGEPNLIFFRTDDNAYEKSISLQKDEEKRIRISSLGTGKMLKILNNDENKIGAYKVEF